MLLFLIRVTNPHICQTTKEKIPITTTIIIIIYTHITISRNTTTATTTTATTATVTAATTISSTATLEGACHFGNAVKGVRALQSIRASRDLDRLVGYLPIAALCQGLDHPNKQ